jgi:hypothetical protein
VITEKISKEMLDTVRQNLSDESLEKIDFDKLTEILDTVGNNFNRHEKLELELEFIKNEYRNRIVGMLKSNLACRENEYDAELVVRLADDISEISGEELVKMYGRVASRFRANFPTSFKYLTMPSSAFVAETNWKEHKI